MATVASIFAAVACFAGTQGSSQLVTVQAPAHSTYASLSLWRRDGACWRRVAGPWQARLGRSGLSAHKREGDGGIACWLKLTDGVGLDRDYVTSLRGLLPGTRFAVDAYVRFVREKTLL